MSNGGLLGDRTGDLEEEILKILQFVKIKSPGVYKDLEKVGLALGE